MMVSVVTGSFSMVKEGSSSVRRAREEKILSSSPLFLAYTAMEMQGCGNSGKG